jgi:hypothetical protein
LVVPELISSSLKLRVSGGSAAQDLPQAQAFELELSSFQAHLKKYLKNGFFTEFYKNFQSSFDP